MLEHCGKPLKSHQRQAQIKCPTVWSSKQIKRWPLSIGPQKRSSKTNWNSHWRWKSDPLFPLSPVSHSALPHSILPVGWRQLIYLERETLIMRYEEQTTLSNEHQHQQQQQKQQMRWQLCRIFNFFCRCRCCCFCYYCCCCFEPWSSGQQLRLSTRYSLRAVGDSCPTSAANCQLDSSRWDDSPGGHSAGRLTTESSD